MIVYIDSASFSNATSVFLDELLTIIAPDGYYSDDSYYRQQIDGKLIDLLPCVGIYTVSITAVGETTATFNGNLINNGGDVNAIRGFVYGTSTNPTTSNSVITDTVMAQGTYSLNVTGLTTGVTYYVRAYTIVFGETIYGDELNITPPVNSVEWISGDYPPVAYSGGGTSGENIVNLSGTVEIIGTPVTFRAYGYWAFLEPAIGSIDVSISIGAESRYVDVLTPNINNYSTDLIIPAGTYSWSAIVRFFDDANQAGEGGIVWTQ